MLKRISFFLTNQKCEAELALYPHRYIRASEVDAIYFLGSNFTQYFQSSITSLLTIIYR